jgi:hypothetical protein
VSVFVQNRLLLKRTEIETMSRKYFGKTFENSRFSPCALILELLLKEVEGILNEMNTKPFRADIIVTF